MNKGPRRLVKDGAIARSITVMAEADGPHYLVKTVDGNIACGGLSSGRSLITPNFSWRCFETLANAEADAAAQYEASLAEGFNPVS